MPMQLPNLLELNDSQKELRSQLRHAMTLAAGKPVNLERCNEMIERIKAALDIAEEIKEMLTE